VLRLLLCFSRAVLHHAVATCADHVSHVVGMVELVLQALARVVEHTTAGQWHFNVAIAWPTHEQL
jgi:hypothetical protein